MRILFAGSNEIAVPALEAIAASFNVCAVLTNPDRPKGRGKKLIPSAVKTKALELGLPVVTPERLLTPAREEVAAFQPDLMVVFSYGRIFGPRFLNLFPMGAVNIHPSLLPRHRGPSPISQAILMGDEETGITVQRVALEMDSGDILRQIRYPLDPAMTTAELTEYVSQKSAELITGVLAAVENDTVASVPQDHDQATYCHLIKKEDGLLNWDSPSKELLRKVKAFNPWPHAWTHFEDQVLNIIDADLYSGDSSAHQDEPVGKVVGVDKKQGILVKTKDSLLAVTRLQLQSRKNLDWKSFLNGVKNFQGSILGG